LRWTSSTSNIIRPDSPRISPATSWSSIAKHGERFERTVRVNYPFIHKGVAIYQASFTDGGTRMQLKGWPLLSPRAVPFDVAGAVNKTTSIKSGDSEIRLELSDFRVLQY